MYSEFSTNLKSHLFVAFIAGILFFLGKIELIGLAIISVCWVSIRGFAISQNVVFKLVFLVLLACIAYGISFHMLPGFNNILLLENYLSGEGAATTNRYLNFDKGFLMLFLLDYYIRNKQSAKLMPAISFSIFLSIITMAILAGIAMNAGFVKLSPKIPPMITSWIFLNLLVALSEEALFRGFLQNYMEKYLNKLLGRKLEYIVIFLVALIFTITYHKGGYMLMSLCFIAGIAYGLAFVKTKRIEASILTHFMVNLLHILFFTHPYAV